MQKGGLGLGERAARRGVDIAMASLPTAYASQRFGRKTLDYYAVEGEIVGADPRARSDERRLQDFDGARHTIRLMDASFRLEPGDAAAVLRMQPGPAQRSRPVAVVNHDSGGWTRTHPGAAGLLARAGISRAANWALTMTLFALAALALVWPFLRAFLVEVDPALFGATPSFNVGETAAAFAPVLTGWSFAEITAPLTAQIAGAAPGLEPTAPALIFAAGVLIAALGVYALRSWRLLWAPLFVLALGVVAIGYGGVEGMTGPALAGLSLAAAVFLIGGMINRVRDAARLESRIALLADHLLRQGPQEVVAEAREAETADDDAVAHDAVEEDAAERLAGAAGAAALREPGGEDEAGESGEADQDEDVAEEAGAASDIAPGAGEAVAEPDAQTPLGPPEGEAVDAPAPAPDADTERRATEAEASGQTPAHEPGAPEPQANDPAQDAAPTEVDAQPDSAEAEAEPVGPDAETAADDGAAPADEAAAIEAEADAPDPAASDVTSGEAEGPKSDLDAAAPAGLDPEEAERLRTDPRYASRAIVLPPPPPMPEPADGDHAADAAAPAHTAQTLKPSAPLPDNVVPIFAAAAPSREAEPEPAQDETITPKQDDPEGGDRA